MKSGFLCSAVFFPFPSGPEVHSNHGGLDPCPQRIWHQCEEAALFHLSHPTYMYFSVPSSPHQPVFIINFIVTGRVDPSHAGRHRVASDKALGPTSFGATVVGMRAGNGPHGWGSTMTGGRGQPEACCFGEVHSPNYVPTPLKFRQGLSSPTCPASSPG